MDKDYTLNFTIPQGPTGPSGPQGETGPTGPAGERGVGLQAYAGIYNDEGNQILLNSTILYPLLLPNKMPNYNITYQGIDSFIIEQDGVYEINYGCIYSAETVYGSTKTCTLRVRANGVDIPGSVINDTVKNSDDVTNRIYSSMNNSVIAELKTEDNIYLLFNSNSGGTVSFPDGINAIMTIKRLN